MIVRGPPHGPTATLVELLVVGVNQEAYRQISAPQPESGARWLFDGARGYWADADDKSGQPATPFISTNSGGVVKDRATLNAYARFLREARARRGSCRGIDTPPTYVTDIVPLLRAMPATVRKAKRAVVEAYHYGHLVFGDDGDSDAAAAEDAEGEFLKPPVAL